MAERFTHFSNWEKYISTAELIAKVDTNNKLWQQTYIGQVILTEMELRNLGIPSDTEPSNIPEVNRVQNLNQIDPKNELALIEIIGMPGAGKDTMVSHMGKQNIQNLYYTPIEGYEKSQKYFPHKDISINHMQAYGGYELEIGDIVDELTYMEKPAGVGLLNRSVRDNFLAFGYSFFLSGYIDLEDLLLSQRFFHYFQYSPTLIIKNKPECLDNITASTIVFMIKPELSLVRKPRRGRILNTEFLNILYSQYLRMISRLSTMKQRNLAILDMSGSKEDSTELFQRTIEQIVKY